MSNIYIALDTREMVVDAVYLDKKKAETYVKRLNDDQKEINGREDEWLVTKKMKSVMKLGQIIYFVLDSRDGDYFPTLQDDELENLWDDPGSRLYFYATLDDAKMSRANILKTAAVKVQRSPFYSSEDINVANVIKIYKIMIEKWLYKSIHKT